MRRRLLNLLTVSLLLCVAVLALWVWSWREQNWVTAQLAQRFADGSRLVRLVGVNSDCGWLDFDRKNVFFSREDFQKKDDWPRPEWYADGVYFVRTNPWERDRRAWPPLYFYAWVNGRDWYSSVCVPH